MIDYYKQKNLPELRTLTKLSLSNKIQAEHAKMLMPRICRDYWICYLFVHVMREFRCFIWVYVFIYCWQKTSTSHYGLNANVHCMIHISDCCPGRALCNYNKHKMSPWQNSLPITYRSMVYRFNLTTKKELTSIRKNFRIWSLSSAFMLPLTNRYSFTWNLKEVVRKQTTKI